VIIALALVVGALLVGWLVPGYLLRLDLRRRDPVPVIVAWLLSMAGFLLAFAVGVTLLMTPGHGTVGALAGLRDSWIHIGHGTTPHAEELGGVLGGLLLAAVTVRLAISIAAELRRVRRTRQERLEVLRLAAHADDVRPRTLWLSHDRPLAFSLPGKPGVIVATEGLRRHLSPDGVAAVLAHERAHLRARHHLLATITGVASRTFRFVPLFRAAPDALNDLVELAADEEAVREQGVGAVRAALRAVTWDPAPNGALAIGQDAVELRLARLAMRTPPSRRARRVLQCGAAGLAATVVPFAAGSIFLLVLAAIGYPAGLG
jgi:Zn-dependent protease with chaperone function